MLVSNEQLSIKQNWDCSMAVQMENTSVEEANKKVIRAKTNYNHLFHCHIKAQIITELWLWDPFHEQLSQPNLQ